MSIDINHDGAVTVIANLLHWMAWASWYEDEGGSLSGCRVQDHAPRTPHAARAVAEALVKEARMQKWTIPAADYAHAFVGSGGGDGEMVPQSLPRGEFSYYTGDDGNVRLWCEYGGQNNKAVAPFGDSAWFPDTITAVMTYDLVDPDGNTDDQPCEYGFTDGAGDDEALGGRVGEAETASIRAAYTRRCSPREAGALCAGRYVRAITNGGVEVWSAEADAVQDVHTGMYRSETLHLTAFSVSALEMVKRLANIK